MNPGLAVSRIVCTPDMIPIMEDAARECESKTPQQGWCHAARVSRANKRATASLYPIGPAKWTEMGRCIRLQYDNTL